MSSAPEHVALYARNDRGHPKILKMLPEKALFQRSTLVTCRSRGISPYRKPGVSSTLLRQTKKIATDSESNRGPSRLMAVNGWTYITRPDRKPPVFQRGPR